MIYLHIFRWSNILLVMLILDLREWVKLDLIYKRKNYVKCLQIFYVKHIIIDIVDIFIRDRFQKRNEFFFVRILIFDVFIKKDFRQKFSEFSLKRLLLQMGHLLFWRRKPFWIHVTTKLWKSLLKMEFSNFIESRCWKESLYSFWAIFFEGVESFLNERSNSWNWLSNDLKKNLDSMRLKVRKKFPC